MGYRDSLLRNLKLTAIQFSLGHALLRTIVACAGVSFLVVSLTDDFFMPIRAFRKPVKLAAESSFVLSGPTPQLTAHDNYQDRLEALNTSDPIPVLSKQDITDVKSLKYAVFLPTFVCYSITYLLIEG